MPSYPLILDAKPLQRGWLIEWDNDNLRLLAPEGQLALELPLNQLHLVIHMAELDVESKIVFKLPDGSLAFKKADKAAIDIRKLVLDSMKSDPGFLEHYRREARAQIIVGTVMFFVCGSLFGLYCWWASVAPDPVPTWVHYFGWLIHLVLLICLAGAIGSPAKVIFYWRRLANLRMVEP